LTAFCFSAVPGSLIFPSTTLACHANPAGRPGFFYGMQGSGAPRERRRKARRFVWGLGRKSQGLRAVAFSQKRKKPKAHPEAAAGGPCPFFLSLFFCLVFLPRFSRFQIQGLGGEGGPNDFRPNLLADPGFAQAGGFDIRREQPGDMKNPRALPSPPQSGGVRRFSGHVPSRPCPWARPESRRRRSFWFANLAQPCAAEARGRIFSPARSPSAGVPSKRLNP